MRTSDQGKRKSPWLPQSWRIDTKVALPNLDRFVMALVKKPVQESHQHYDQPPPLMSFSAAIRLRAEAPCSIADL